MTKDQGSENEPDVKDAGTERRQFPRLPLPIPVFVRGTDENGKEYLEFGTAANFSAEGALVLIPRRGSRMLVSAGVTIYLEIPKAPLPSAYLPETFADRIEGTVLRVDHADTYHVIAVQFTKPLTSK